MSRLRERHDAFQIDGGCSCPGTRTLYQLRIEGHTAACTTRRREAAEIRKRMLEKAADRPSINRDVGVLREARRDAV